MSYQSEPEIQFIARKVAAKILDEISDRIASADSGIEICNVIIDDFSDKLKSLDHNTILNLKSFIDDALKEWEREYRIIALKHDSIV